MDKRTLNKGSILTQEDVENISETITNGKMGSIVKLLDALGNALDKQVLIMDLTKHSFSDLGVLKAKADGARFVINRFKDEILNLKNQDKETGGKSYVGQ